MFDKVQKSLERLYSEATGYLEAYDTVHGGGLPPLSKVVTRWVPSLQNWVKANCDASLKEEVQGEGLGCCVCNHQGVLISSAAHFSPASSSVLSSDR